LLTELLCFVLESLNREIFADDTIFLSFQLAHDFLGLKAISLILQAEYRMKGDVEDIQGHYHVDQQLLEGWESDHNLREISVVCIICQSEKHEDSRNSIRQ